MFLNGAASLKLSTASFATDIGRNVDQLNEYRSETPKNACKLPASPRALRSSPNGKFDEATEDPRRFGGNVQTEGLSEPGLAPSSRRWVVIDQVADFRASIETLKSGFNEFRLPYPSADRLLASGARWERPE